MKMRGQRLVLPSLLALAVVYLTKSAAVQDAVHQALTLCARSVVPALFPFLVLSSLLVSFGFGEWAGRWLGGMMRTLFGLPPAAASALVLGFAAGYPVGAGAAAELYRKGMMTREESCRLLAFCNNANPVFLVTVLGRGVFASARIGMWLWLIHVAAALITGMLFRSGGETGRKTMAPRPKEAGAGAAGAFVEAVRQSGWNCVAISAFVTVFYVLSRPFAALGGGLGCLMTGLTELFSLTPLLTPDGAGFVTAALCAGFGGISVLCQTAAVLEGSGLSMRWCVTGKLVQGLISAILAYIVWQWI